MTRPTDEELDEMVVWLDELPCCHDGPHETSARCKSCEKTVADAITALRTLPAVQVAVTPLGWVYDERRGVWSAQDGFGRHYTVSDSQWFHGSLSEFIWVDGGDEAAKAAAQADYEARIRSALTAKPSPDVAALVEALQDALLWTVESQNRTNWREKAHAALAALEGKA